MNIGLFKQDIFDRPNIANKYSDDEKNRINSGIVNEILRKEKPLIPANFADLWKITNISLIKPMKKSGPEILRARFNHSKTITSY